MPVTLRKPPLELLGCVELPGFHCCKPTLDLGLMGRVVGEFQQVQPLPEFLAFRRRELLNFLDEFGEAHGYRLARLERGVNRCAYLSAAGFPPAKEPMINNPTAMKMHESAMLNAGQGFAKRTCKSNSRKSTT